RRIGAQVIAHLRERKSAVFGLSAQFKRDQSSHQTIKGSRMSSGGLRQFVAPARSAGEKVRNPQRRRRMNGLRRPQAQNQPCKLETRRRLCDILMRHESPSLSDFVTGTMIPTRQDRVLEKSQRGNRQDAKAAKKKPGRMLEERMKTNTLRSSWRSWRLGD